MEKELNCEIVKDLLPLYVDGMVSEISKRSIESHLKNCTNCREIHRNMTVKIEDTSQSDIKDVKRFLKKTKLMYFLYGLGGLSLIAVIVCLIVDLAVNKGITWSLIVGGTVIYSDAILYSVMVCKKNKGFITMSVISIGVACLLFIIQFTRYYLMHAGTLWIFRYGYPIMLLWLAIVWIPILCRHFFNWNIWDCIAVFLLLVMLGNYGTQLIIGDYEWNQDLWSLDKFLNNGLGQIIGVILFGIIGRIRKWRK